MTTDLRITGFQLAFVLVGTRCGRGDAITVWFNNPVCGYWRELGRQYRAVLTARLATYAERYGAATPFVDFRVRLRCRHCGSGDVSTIVDAPHATAQERWEHEPGDDAQR